MLHKKAVKAMLTSGTKFWDLGNKEPFTTMSKNSLARVMEAVIKTASKIHNTHSLDTNYNRSWVLYRVEIPVGMEADFEEISKGKLSEPPQVSI